jgi:2-polyprenyl-3-methyl-5-hydroxy-6-metoxy-1,4-benzoquinol methylase
MTDTIIANAGQSARWNAQAGRSWAELGDLLDRLLAPFVPPLLDAVGPVAGRRILDVGCGAGALTLAAAERGASGLGVDISAPLVEAARAAPSAWAPRGPGSSRPMPRSMASSRRASTPSFPASE